MRLFKFIASSRNGTAKAVNPKEKKAATINPILASSFTFLLALADVRASRARLKEISNTIVFLFLNLTN